METTRVNTSGSPMHRDAPGRQGGGRLFYSRRERDLGRGLLSAKGHGNDYLVFQPAKYFTRMLGDRVLRLNEALSEVRSQGAELIPSLGVARLQAHYAELDRLIEATRDKLADLTDYCNKGFEGRFREALEGIEPAAFDRAGHTGRVRRAGTRKRCSRQTHRTPMLPRQPPVRPARTFSTPCGSAISSKASLPSLVATRAVSPFSRRRSSDVSWERLPIRSMTRCGAWRAIPRITSCPATATRCRTTTWDWRAVWRRSVGTSTASSPAAGGRWREMERITNPAL